VAQYHAADGLESILLKDPLKIFFRQYRPIADTAEQSIEVALAFASFEDYWRSQTPAFAPQGKIVANLSNEDRLRLKKIVQRTLLTTSGGGITYAAGANAVKACCPTP
jgi:hypothetical protein